MVPGGTVSDFAFVASGNRTSATANGTTIYYSNNSNLNQYSGITRGHPDLRPQRQPGKLQWIDLYVRCDEPADPGEQGDNHGAVLV